MRGVGPIVRRRRESRACHFKSQGLRWIECSAAGAAGIETMDDAVSFFADNAAPRY